MAILRVRDEGGNVYDIPAIVGPQRQKGDKGDAVRTAVEAV